MGESEKKKKPPRFCASNIMYFQRVKEEKTKGRESGHTRRGRPLGDGRTVPTGIGTTGVLGGTGGSTRMTGTEGTETGRETGKKQVRHRWEVGVLDTVVSGSQKPGPHHPVTPVYIKGEDTSSVSNTFL